MMLTGRWTQDYNFVMFDQPKGGCETANDLSLETIDSSTLGMLTHEDITKQFSGDVVNRTCA